MTGIEAWRMAPLRSSGKCVAFAIRYPSKDNETVDFDALIPCFGDIVFVADQGFVRLGFGGPLKMGPDYDRREVDDGFRCQIACLSNHGGGLDTLTINVAETRCMSNPLTYLEVLRSPRARAAALTASYIGSYYTSFKFMVNIQLDPCFHGNALATLFQPPPDQRMFAMVTLGHDCNIDEKIDSRPTNVGVCWNDMDLIDCLKQRGFQESTSMRRDYTAAIFGGLNKPKERLGLDTELRFFVKRQHSSRHSFDYDNRTLVDKFRPASTDDVRFSYGSPMYRELQCTIKAHALSVSAQRDLLRGGLKDTETESRISPERRFVPTKLVRKEVLALVDSASADSEYTKRGAELNGCVIRHYSHVIHTNYAYSESLHIYWLFVHHYLVEILLALLPLRWHTHALCEALMWLPTVCFFPRSRITALVVSINNSVAQTYRRRAVAEKRRRSLRKSILNE